MDKISTAYLISILIGGIGVGDYNLSLLIVNINALQHYYEIGRIFNKLSMLKTCLQSTYPIHFAHFVAICTMGKIKRFDVTRASEKKTYCV